MSPHVLIRTATLADAASMGAMWLRSALTAYEGIFPPEAPEPTAAAMAESWRRVIERGPPGATALVACHGTGQIVGTVAVVADRDGPYPAQIRRLYVDPECWGRGIGRQLHDAALDRLRSAGHEVVAL